MKKYSVTLQDMVIDYPTLQKLRILVPNHTGGAVEISGVSASFKDTNYRYFAILESVRKLTKAQVVAVQSYIHGVVDCIKSYK